MPRTRGRRFTPCLVFGFLAVLPVGCGQNAKVPPGGAPKISVEAVAADPPVIELSDPKVSFRDPQTVQCEVKYRITQGKPQPYDAYDLEISFPGTTNAGIKMMQSWELKMEGTIKDSFNLSQPGAKTFEIFIAETAKLDRPGHKKISNVVSGTIE